MRFPKRLRMLQIQVGLAVFLTIVLLYLCVQYKPSGRSSTAMEWSARNKFYQSASVLLKPTQCSTSAEIVIIVTSYAKNHKLRYLIRDAYSRLDLSRIKMARVFLLGKADASTDASVKRESAENEDIVLGDFIESYRNLTRKHLMGLEWAVAHCPNAKFVLKQDDDIIVDYYQLSWFTTLMQGQGDQQADQNPKFLDSWKRHIQTDFSEYIIGKALRKMPVIRDKASKWYVRHDELETSVYPDFVSGWAYITTVATASKLVKLAPKHPYFWIDDALITGILRESANITIIDFSEVFTHYLGELLCCLDYNLNKDRINRTLWCDYIVAPTNGQHQLLQLSQQYSSYCFSSKRCERRKSSELLTKTCVVTPEQIQLLKRTDD